MACRVIRNNEGKIEQVLDANSNPDPLFDQILESLPVGETFDENIVSTVSSRKRDENDPKEIALVMYAQTLASSVVIPETEVTLNQSDALIDGTFYEGKMYGNEVTFDNLPNKGLKKLGDMVTSSGNELVSNDPRSHSGWNELANQGFAMYFENQWVYLPEDLVIEEYEDNEADKAAKAFFDQLGFKVESVPELGDSNALIDLSKQLVQVVEGKRNAYTLSEEASHLAIAMLTDNELESLYKDIVKRPEYAKTKVRYDFATENEYKREAIGQVVSQVLVEKTKYKADKNIFMKLLDLISRKLSKFVSYFNGNVASYSSIADMVINKSSRELQEDGVYYQKSTVTQEEILNSLEANTNLISEEKDGNRYKLKTGQVIISRVSDAVSAARNKLFKNFASEVTEEELNNYADAGTVGHFYQEILIQRLIDGLPLTYSEILSEVTSTLKPVMDRPDAFFAISALEFGKLAKFSTELYSRIMKKDPGAIIKLEHKIFVESLNEAGTIDMLILHSDGSVSIYDYKFKFNFKEKDYRLSVNDSIQYGYQLGRYKSHLSKIAGVTHFDETVIAPIGASFTGDSLSFQTPNMKDYFIEETADSPILTPVARQEMKQFDEKFNAKLNALQAERERIGALYKKNSSNNTLYKRYREIDEAIINLQMFYDPRKLFEMMDRLNQYAQNANDIQDLVSAYKSLLLFEDFDIVLEPVIEEFKSELGIETSELERQARDLVAESRRTLNKLVVQMVAYHTETGTVNWDDPYKAKTGLSYLFDGIDEDSSPTHKRLRELLGAASRQARKDAEATIAELDEVYQEYANYVGVSTSMFDPIINKKTGNLISKVSSKYYDDLKTKKAKGGKDFIEWSEQNQMFDLEAYTQAVNQLQASFAGDPRLAEKLRDFEVKHNVNQNVSARYTSGFLRVDYDNLIEEYVSDEWKTIEGKQPIINYVEKYGEVMNRISRASGKDIGRNMIPEISRQGLERLTAIGLKGSLRGLEQSLMIREQDLVFGGRDPETGEPSLHVPFYFTDPLVIKATPSEERAIRQEAEAKFTKPEEKAERESYIETELAKLARAKGKEAKTTDVHKAMVNFVYSSYESINKQEIEDSVLSLKYILNERGNEQATDAFGDKLVDKATQTVVSLLGITNATADRFDKLIDMHLYGRYTQGKDVKVGRYSGTKLVKALMKYQGLKFIAFNPLLAVSNSLNNVLSTTAFWKEKQYFDKEMFTNAAKMFMTRDPKAMTLLEHFYLAKDNGTKSTDPREIAAKYSANKALRALTMGNIYSMHRVPNEVLSRILFLSMAQNYSVQDGFLKKSSEDMLSILDQYKEKDGEFYLDADYKDINLIEGKIHTLHNKLSNRMMGETSQDQRNIFSTTILGQVFLHFRNWMPGMAKARYQDYKYDEITDTLEAGRLRVMLEEIGFAWQDSSKSFMGKLFSSLTYMASMPVRDIVGNLNNYNLQTEEQLEEQLNKINILNDTNMSLPEFKEMKMNKLRAAAFDVRILLTVVMLYQLAAALDWDEEDAPMLSRFGYRTSKRAMLELSFFLNPVSATEILSSPFSLLKEIGTVTKIVGNGIQETSEMLGIIEENKKDRSPLLYETSKAIPILNMFLRGAGVYSQGNDKQLVEYFLK